MKVLSVLGAILALFGFRACSFDDYAAITPFINNFGIAVGDVPFEVTYSGNFALSVAKQAGGDAIYLWDFGDGSTGTGSEATHTYETPGVYPVTLTVTLGNLSGSTTRANAVAAVDPQGFYTRVRGVVQRSDETPVVGATVTTNFGGSAVTDGQGSYSLPIVFGPPNLPTTIDVSASIQENFVVTLQGSREDVPIVQGDRTPVEVIVVR